MWKIKGKNLKQSSLQDNTERKERFPLAGARKVALFLSVFDSETAEKLLSLLDPEVAYMVADEAKTIDPTSHDNVEKIVLEFLDTVGSGTFGEELTGAIVAHARSVASKSAEKRETPRTVDSEILLSSLDAIAPEHLATLLAHERPTTIAAVLTLLSPSRRDSLCALLSEEQKAVVSNITMKSGLSGALNSLENVLFERALDYER